LGIDFNGGIGVIGGPPVSGAVRYVVESDSMEVVNAVLNLSEFRGMEAVVIDDCRHLLTMLAWKQ
jgi:hypothetical protein